MTRRHFKPHFAIDRNRPLPEIHNPNLQSQGPGGGSGGDMRTTMAFIVLAILLFFGYQYFFTPKQASNQPGQTQSQPEQAQKASPAAAPKAPAATASQTKVKGAQPAITAPHESETTVENELYKIVLSNRGGQVLHWYLKKYNDANLTKQLGQALYQVSISGGQHATGGTLLAPASITFHYAENGLDAVKIV